MATEYHYINDELAKKINETAVLEEVVSRDLSLKKSGSSLVADCPSCGSKKGFSVNPAKDIFSCFSCGISGKGASGYLTKIQGLNYPSALQALAEMYHIDLVPSANKQTAKSKKESKLPFRDAQLLASGIPTKEQKWMDKVAAEKWLESDRYESATINAQAEIIPGDDMVLHYIDFANERMLYKDHKGKMRPFFRVRWNNPALHLDRNGKEMKYKSPYGGGNHLWLPQSVIKAYNENQVIQTLGIVEGEKKADKLSLSGLPTVGLAGIHNLSFDGMTTLFEQLIKKCSVANVIFIIDADWQDLGGGEVVDARPKTFFNAVKRFRDYFYAYKNNQIELSIYFAYGKDIVFKGADDLLVRKLKGQEEKLIEDFKTAMIDRQGHGEYVNVHNITTVSEYKLMEYWSLQSADAFKLKYKEELVKRKEFTLRGLKYRINEDGEIELQQALLPHEQYWLEKTFTRNGNEVTTLTFDYYNVLKFLRNRGFGLFEFNNDRYRIVQMNGKIVSETNAHKIQQFVKQFTEEINEIDVLRMILKGGPQYLGPNMLGNMYYVNPEFAEPEKESQILVFKNCFWKITADAIEQRPLSELPKNVWSNKIIDFEPKYLGYPMAKVNRVGDNWEIKETPEMMRCQIAQFIYVTSNFWWHKQEELAKFDDGHQRYTAKKNPDKLTKEEVSDIITHVVCKMIAAGYVMHEYRAKDQMKAIICMDGVETEVGKSQGGTGKSIYATMFENLLPTDIIDAKKPKLTEDPFIYENTDERTAIIVFDDCRVNLDFEFFFSQITRGINVNKKGIPRFTIPAPKFIFSTNHAMSGDGNSFNRRQYLLAFSNYFNEHRTPRDHFGNLMFVEWDYEQWNLFYNFMATCIQTYLRFPDLNKFTIPSTDLERRKLRQRIGENFIEFADMYFGVNENKDLFDQSPQSGGFRNKPVNKLRVYNDYTNQYRNDARYCNPKVIKEKCRLYAQYKELEFGLPGLADGRLKHNSNEYVLISDNEFSMGKQFWETKID